MIFVLREVPPAGTRAYRGLLPPHGEGFCLFNCRLFWTGR